MAHRLTVQSGATKRIYLREKLVVPPPALYAYSTFFHRQTLAGSNPMAYMACYFNSDAIK